ncbi:MAG: tetratricopeptide repeat protein [Deltaproteobacteria bacterium]|nr:tetratricopeptide repeat protein [Deltaproteobacteria bacterium]
MIARPFRILWVLLVIGLFSCAAPRPVTRSLGDRAGDLNRRGIKEYAQGDLEAAEADFLHALQLNRRIDARRGILDNLNNLAALRLRRGNPSEALPFLQEGLSIAEEVGDTAAQIDFDIHIGAAREMEDKDKAALSSYDRAESAARSLGDERRLQAALGRRGQLELALQQWEKAEVDLKQALDLARSRNDEKGTAMRESDLGLLALHQGNPDTASALLTSALKKHRRLEDPPGIALDLQRLGRLSNRQGNPAQAEAYLKRAFLSHRADGDSAGAMEDLLLLTDLYRKQGEGENASNTLKKAEKILPSLHRKNMIDDYHRMEEEVQKVFP